jgi:hypothetical protein
MGNISGNFGKSNFEYFNSYNSQIDGKLDKKAVDASLERERYNHFLSNYESPVFVDYFDQNSFQPAFQPQKLSSFGKNNRLVFGKLGGHFRSFENYQKLGVQNQPIFNNEPSNLRNGYAFMGSQDLESISYARFGKNQNSLYNFGVNSDLRTSFLISSKKQSEGLNPKGGLELDSAINSILGERSDKVKFSGNIPLEFDNLSKTFTSYFNSKVGRAKNFEMVGAIIKNNIFDKIELGKLAGRFNTLPEKMWVGYIMRITKNNLMGGKKYIANNRLSYLKMFSGDGSQEKGMKNLQNSIDTVGYFKAYRKRILQKINILVLKKL